MITNSHIYLLLDEIALTNCEKAYKALFMQMHESLTDFARSILKSEEDAEEVVSDFFIVIWQRRASLRSIENPRLYFFVSIKNAALNKLKSNKSLQLPHGGDWQTSLKSVFFNPEELLLSAEIVEKVMKAVNELPPRCKIIFKLIKEEGLKYSEVARLLEISVKTVEAQMAIALRRIKSHSEFKNEFPELHSILTKKK
ncbi:MAG: RNA polymerase sigma-70 factor [Chitinophagaceae bacterium]|nr:RNA polymerase sigma-70 factor [Chitinophagaceae bacterium]